MKVLALNSSPSGKRSGTTGILTPFLEGMEEAGAEVELIYVHNLDIKPCQGCMACWWKTPGRCVQNDDMGMILSKMAEANIIVFATPLYVDGMNSQMKTLIDRSIPLVQPFFEIRDGHCRHPLREDVTQGRVVLVSACGFYELDNFDPLVMHVKAICKNLGREFSGALLRPYAKILPLLKRKGVPVDEIYDAAKDAGIQLVQDGEISAETLTTVSRDLVTRKELVEGINKRFNYIQKMGFLMSLGTRIMNYHLQRG